MSLFPFVLFDQSFSQDYGDFFFSTETEKKLTSKISVLKMNLDLYPVEMEIERPTHQMEEKALRAQVIEAEERRDVVVQKALKKVEAMKKECDGIPSYFILCSLFFLIFCSFFA
jgi:hypothetical protein